jgi:hypothetical protein
VKRRVSQGSRFGIGRSTMPDEEISLAHQIRKKVAAGLLPRVLTDKMLTGYGHIGPCDRCDQPIYPPQVEYKFAINPDSGRLFRLHMGRVGMWLGQAAAPWLREARQRDRHALKAVRGAAALIEINPIPSACTSTVPAYGKRCG